MFSARLQLLVEQLIEVAGLPFSSNIPARAACANTHWHRRSPFCPATSYVFHSAIFEPCAPRKLGKLTLPPKDLDGPTPHMIYFTACHVFYVAYTQHSSEP